MSDLIDRYLAAVARELPPEQRADIAAELRDELMSGVEAREDALARPLTSPELEAVLVEFGNPLVVAGRYRTMQHLIGPQVFPFWWAAVRASLVVIAAVYLVLIVLALVLARPVSGIDLPSPLVVLGFAFGAITLVCALVERFGRPEVMARWRPARLPPAHGKTRSRFELLTEVGMGVVFLLWWVELIHFRNTIPAADVRVEMAPVWDRYFWWILGYSVVEIASNVIALARPDRVQLVRWMAIWRSLLGATILLGVIQADRFLIVTGSAGKAQALLDLGARGVIVVTIAAFLLRAVTEAWRLHQDERRVRAAI